MGCVASILAAKGSQVHTISPDATAYEAIEGMVRSNVGSLIVSDGTTILGIFTERDYLRRVTLQDRDAKATRVRDVMTPHIICVDPSRTIGECMAMMTQERIRHLPVMERDRLVGIISIGDVVKYLSKEREVEIRHLTEYITGRPSE